MLTDNEIIKACPFCGEDAYLDRHDIFCDCGAKIEIPVYVEAKESIGGLPTYNEAKQEMIDAWNSRVDEEHIKTEAIKEFAERLKERFLNLEYRANTTRKTLPIAFVKDQSDWMLHEVSIETIDNLVKEMVGDSDV